VGLVVFDTTYLGLLVVLYAFGFHTYFSVNNFGFSTNFSTVIGTLRVVAGVLITGCTLGLTFFPPDKGVENKNVIN